MNKYGTLRLYSNTTSIKNLVVLYFYATDHNKNFAKQIGMELQIRHKNILFSISESDEIHPLIGKALDQAWHLLMYHGDVKGSEHFLCDETNVMQKIHDELTNNHTYKKQKGVKKELEQLVFIVDKYAKQKYIVTDIISSKWQ